MKARFTVEFRTNAAWGKFDRMRYSDQNAAIEHAADVLTWADIPYTAARVWRNGPSIPGDSVVWDSRRPAA